MPWVSWRNVKKHSVEITNANVTGHWSANICSSEELSIFSLELCACLSTGGHDLSVFNRMLHLLLYGRFSQACFWWYTDGTLFPNQKQQIWLLSPLLETPSNTLLCGHMNSHEWGPVIILEIVVFHLKCSCHHNWNEIKVKLNPWHFEIQTFMFQDVIYMKYH